MMSWVVCLVVVVMGSSILTSTWLCICVVCVGIVLCVLVLCCVCWYCVVCVGIVLCVGVVCVGVVCGGGVVRCLVRTWMCSVIFQAWSVLSNYFFWQRPGLSKTTSYSSALLCCCVLGVITTMTTTITPILNEIIYHLYLYSLPISVSLLIIIGILLYYVFIVYSVGSKDPVRLFKRLSTVPLGQRLFSLIISVYSPYTGIFPFSLLLSLLLTLIRDN
jgi:hypothetical protein